jgi:AraC-like DNA-binding protein
MRRRSRPARQWQRRHVARLQEARWFMKNIQQRFDTILRVSQAIVERQKSFFTHGEIAMKPLVLREIADELGLHESTISRVTTAKYMATPLRHLRAEVLLRLVAEHRGRRQCQQHRGAGADPAARGGRRPEEAAVGQPAVGRCWKNRASRWRGARWPSTARPEDRPGQPAALP